MPALPTAPPPTSTAQGSEPLPGAILGPMPPLGKGTAAHPAPSRPHKVDLPREAGPSFAIPGASLAFNTLLFLTLKTWLPPAFTQAPQPPPPPDNPQGVPLGLSSP